MTNSHLLGLVTFAAFALFALLAWAVSNKHPDVRRDLSLQRRTRQTALFLVVLGAAFGYFAFFIDYGMRVTTLREVMVEGSVQASPGTPPPAHTVTFAVEHPGVEHELFLSPTAELFQPPESDVDVSFSLHGPDGEALLPERTERFAVRTVSWGERADWDGKTFPFTPAVTGQHMLRVKPLTMGIPRIQVRIEDPANRDGERMPGY